MNKACSAVGDEQNGADICKLSVSYLQSSFNLKLTENKKLIKKKILVSFSIIN